MEEINRKKTKIIFSPHFDDAIFSLGGTILLHPEETYIVNIFTGNPEEMVTSWWDKKCGFENSTEAMQQRRQEDDEAMEILGMVAKKIDLNILEKQYRKKLNNKEELIEEIEKKLDHSNIKKIIGSSFLCEIFLPLNDFHQDHEITKIFGINYFKEIEGIKIYFYEDYPYQIFPKILLKKNLNKFLNKNHQYLKNKKNYIFTSKQFQLKVKAMSSYKTQFTGRAKYMLPLVKISNKLSALFIGKIFNYSETVYEYK